MSDQPQHDPQNTNLDTNTANSAPQPVQRRKRTFPAVLATNAVTGEKKLFYRDEWAEIMAQQAATDEAEKVAREAELAAGRPPRLEPPPATPADSASSEPAASEPDPSPASASASALAETAPAPNAASAPKQPTPRTNGMNTAMHDARSTVADWSRSLSRVSSPFSAPPPDYERHSRLCAICSHPDRDAIEGDFVRWRSLVDIASDYRVPRSTLYRHVHATGLFLRRTSEVRRVMEAFLEEAEHFPASEFDVVTRAVRAYSHLDDDGRWWEPSRMNYILSGPFWPDVPPRGSR